MTYSVIKHPFESDELVYRENLDIGIYTATEGESHPEAERSLVTVSDWTFSAWSRALWLEEQTCGSSAAALRRQGSSDPMDMVTLAAVRRS